MRLSLRKKDAASATSATSDDLNNAEAEKEAGQTLAPTTTTQSQDVPPDGGYGWVCVAAVFMINAHTWGINSAYGVFLAHYISTSTFRGATSLDYAFIGGLSLSMGLLIAPGATIFNRLYGTRMTLLVGIFFQTLSLIGASFAKDLWQLVLSQGVCFGWGIGFLFVGSVGVIPQWFTKKRSLANGTAAAGSGFGGLIYSLATNAMIKNIGLGWALRILGIVTCAVNLVCAILVRDRSKAIGSAQLAFDYKLFLRPEFCAFEAWGFFSMLGYVVLNFSLPNYANSVGLTASQGTVIGAVFQLGQMLGRPIIGYNSDTFGRLNMAIGTTVLAAIFSLAIWIPAHSYGVLVFYAIVQGTVAGTFWATVAPVGAELVGLKILPSALSITWLVITLPMLFSEPIGLAIVDYTPAAYLGTQIFTGMMYIAGAMSLLYARAWKVGDMEKKESELEGEASTPKRSFMKRTLIWIKV